MIDHSEILPRLAAYHDGALPDHERTALYRHLESCAECRARLDDWTALDKALESLSTPEPAPGELAALALRRIQSQKFGDGRIHVHRPASVRWKVWAGAAVAAAVLAASAAILMRSEHRMDDPSDLAGAPTITDGLASTVPGGPTDASTGEENPSSSEAHHEARSDALARSQVTDPGHNASSLPEQGASGTEPPDREPKTLAAAPQPIRTEDSGIPQDPERSARPAFAVDIHYRLYDRIDAAYVELNVIPMFEVEFAPVSYVRLDLPSDRWDVANPEPTLLSPEDTYLVSNLRLERSTLLALVTNQAPTAAVRYRLADVTWRLANITADQDDVRSAISAQSEVLRQNPEVGTQSRARLAFLRGLVR